LFNTLATRAARGHALSRRAAGIATAGARSATPPARTVSGPAESRGGGGGGPAACASRGSNPALVRSAGRPLHSCTMIPTGSNTHRFDSSKSARGIRNARALWVWVSLHSPRAALPSRHTHSAGRADVTAVKRRMRSAAAVPPSRGPARPGSSRCDPGRLGPPDWPPALHRPGPDRRARYHQLDPTGLILTRPHPTRPVPTGSRGSCRPGPALSTPVGPG
jgi:hypothetical protein